MKTLLTEIRNCTHCAKHLPAGPRPIVQASKTSRLLIIGQAPGSKVHASGVPWDDPSGRLLRQWLGINSDTFYDPAHIALVPMGFCYPGKGTSGDLPPRPECAPLWHSSLLENMPEITLTILIGHYAQKSYLKNKAHRTLTDTVRAHQDYLPDYLPLPHPSPRNRHWLQKNTWFENVLKDLPELVSETLTPSS